MIAEEPNISGSGQQRPQRVFDGIGAAPGIAIGKAHLYVRSKLSVDDSGIDGSSVEQELERFEDAVERAEKDLAKIIGITREKLGEESAEIFEAQRMMLRDEALYQHVVDRIRKKHDRADFAVTEVMDKHRRRMEASNSKYIRERSADLIDVKDRIVRHLRRGKLLSAITPESIVVAENLTAADLILFSRREIRGCVIGHDGATSHVSIMARALGVPTVVRAQEAVDSINFGDTIIVDALRGYVVVEPSPKVVDAYRDQLARHRVHLEEYKDLARLPAETKDGEHVHLRANVEFSQEVDHLDRSGAEGIGLFRTEMLLLPRGLSSLTEEEIFQTYRDVVEAAAPHITTLRLLDLGGDKLLPLAHREHNPFLGWRGIRVLLDRPELLRLQLRATLRASAFGPLRILLPMIGHIEEIERVKAILESVQDELREEGVSFDPQVPLGIMVEVPSVALKADTFAQEVDFFSLGTNDLTQFVLAVDRGNDLVADAFNVFHPAVLSLIDQTVKAGKQAGIPVGICGEVAADPQAVPLLIGLGIGELSASPSYLPEVKRAVRAIHGHAARELAQQALQAGSVAEVQTLLDDWIEGQAPELLELTAREPIEVLVQENG